MDMERLQKQMDFIVGQSKADHPADLSVRCKS